MARLAKEASTNAVKQAFQNGSSVTVLRGDDIIKIYPDGHTEFVRRVENTCIVPSKKSWVIK